MSIIKSYKCDKCNWSLYFGNISIPYYLKKPGFIRKLFRLGPKKVFFSNSPVNNGKQKIDFSTVGQFDVVVCSNCFKVYSRDSKEIGGCKYCKKDSIVKLKDIIDCKCPKCKEGIIKEKLMGIS